MSAAAMANWAAGSSGVGPGVKRRVLRIIFSPRFATSVLGGLWQSHNTQICDFCELCFVEI
jgi:hypothetical protein